MSNTKPQPPLDPAAISKAFDAALAQSGYASFNQWQAASGVSRSTFYNIKYGRFEPQLTNALAIARSAGLTVEQVFGAAYPGRMAKGIAEPDASPESPSTDFEHEQSKREE